MYKAKKTYCLLLWLPVLCAAIILNGCALRNTGWDKKEITEKLNHIFYAPDTAFVLNETDTACYDNNGLPVPAFTALVKEKDIPGCQLIFYFYNSAPSDTAVLSSLMKATMLNDLKIGLGTKTGGYLLSMPFYNSSGKNRMMTIAVAANTAKDSAYLSNKETAVLKTFELRAFLQKAAIAK